MARAASHLRRWLDAWLVIAALLAVLLLVTSVRDYLLVWRILATQQVRRQMAQHVVALEQQLRGTRAPVVQTGELPAVDPERALEDELWLEVRRLDGTIVARRGSASDRAFTSDEESAHFRNRQPLYRVVPSATGDVVVEAFPLYVPGLAPAGDSTEPSDPGPRHGPRSLLVVELAAPLVVREPSILWPIRQNLVINCAGALALLATVLIAGVALRSYERRRWLEAQLEIARDVQGALFPTPTEDYAPVRLAAVYRPAEQVGGDFYDVFHAEDGRVALVIGDVSGKGVPSALVAGMIHGAVRSATWTRSGEGHVVESERLNRLLGSDGAADRYASMFWCYYDPSSSQLHYVNAGHFPPILVSHGDAGAEVATLDTGGPVLGVLDEARYEQGRRELRPGDVLVLYSDGLIEATNARGEEYGVERLRRQVQAFRHAAPESIRDEILASVSDFVGAAAPRDDLTLVVAAFGLAPGDERQPVDAAARPGSLPSLVDAPLTVTAG